MRSGCEKLSARGLRPADLAAARLALLLASTLAGLCPVFPSGLQAQQPRPLPPRSEVPLLQFAELEIVEVRQVSPEPIRLNDVVPVDVVVRNTGTRAATVRAGAPNPGRVRESLMQFGPVRSVGAGRTAVLPLNLLATGNLFRGERFEPTVFLFHPPAPGDGPLGRSFRDGNAADNEHRASLRFDPTSVLRSPLRADSGCRYGQPGCNACVHDVPATFRRASGSSDLRHGFVFSPRERALNGPVPDAFHVEDHVQGAARIPGVANDNYLALSRNARDIGDAAVYLARFDRIRSGGDAWKWADRTSDETDAHYYYRIPGANHAGGMQALGPLLFVAVDCDAGHHCPAFIQIMDVSDPARARVVQRLVLDGSRGELRHAGEPVPSRAAAVAATRLADGRHLLFIRGREANENGWFFLSSGPIDARTRWEYVDFWHRSDLPPGQGWHSWETLNFIGECQTGAIYLLAMGTEDNRAFLYRVTERQADHRQLSFEFVDGRGLNVSGHTLLETATNLSLRYGAAVHVAPNGNLVFYATDRHPPVVIEEFRYHGEHGR